MLFLKFKIVLIDMLELRRKSSVQLVNLYNVCNKNTYCSFGPRRYSFYQDLRSL